MCFPCRAAVGAGGGGGGLLKKINKPLQLGAVPGSPPCPFIKDTRLFFSSTAPGPSSRPWDLNHAGSSHGFDGANAQVGFSLCGWRLRRAAPATRLFLPIPVMIILPGVLCFARVSLLFLGRCFFLKAGIILTWHGCWVGRGPLVTCPPPLRAWDECLLPPLPP